MTILTCVIRGAPSLPSLDTALQVWARALKGQRSQVVRKGPSSRGLQSARGFCSGISGH